jgi:hypothetical protein
MNPMAIGMATKSMGPQVCVWSSTGSPIGSDVAMGLSGSQALGQLPRSDSLAEDLRDVAVGDTPHEAVRAALRSLGEPYAGEMAWA